MEAWAPWISGGFTVLAVAATVVLTHWSQARRDQHIRRAVAKREGVVELVQACERLLDDTTKFCTSYLFTSATGQSPLNHNLGEEGSTITRAKIAAQLVYDDRLRELANRFIAKSGDVRGSLDKTLKNQDQVRRAVQELNDCLGAMSERAREILYQDL